MGIYNHIYIGVYMRLPYSEKELTKVITVHPDSDKIIKGKYCQLTGKLGVKKTKKVIQRIKPDSYIQDHEGLNEDEFFTPIFHEDENDISIFICNNGKYKLKSSGDFFNYQFGDIDITGFIADFKDYYSEYITYYEETYGVEVEVAFGVIHYGN